MEHISRYNSAGYSNKGSRGHQIYAPGLVDVYGTQIGNKRMLSKCKHHLMPTAVAHKITVRRINFDAPP